ncbi:MAG: metallophosphoesterase [Deltaproteobacteria bacterium]|jgi:predicted MPP superfamily phosphohydrolase|nr:metallophosphoesterase [Deltaproteobacteria bacterium]
MLSHPLMPGLMLLAQIVSWRFLQSRLEKSLKYLAIFLYVVFNVAALPAFYYLYYSDSPPTTTAFLWDYVYRPAFIWELVHLCWLPVALLLTILGALFNLLKGQQPKGLSRLFKEDTNKSKLGDPRIVALGVMLALAAYGYYRQLEPPEIKEVAIEVPNLSPALQGYRIALLSDLHYGTGLNLTELARAMAMVAAHGPDLVVLAGDLVDRRAAFGLDYRIPMLGLREVPNGVYAVLGNHDKKVDSVETLITNLESTNLRILQNRGVNLYGKPITLIGFDDTGQNDPFHTDTDFALDFGKVVGQAPRQGDLLIAVSHRPVGVNDAAAHGVRLFLAGHTHGGLVQAPWDPQLNVASLVIGYPHTTGLYKTSGLTLYVTNGLAGLTQARLFAWPEITILTLKNQAE